MFRTQFDPHERRVQNPGSSLHKLYHAEFDSQGTHTLVEDGTEDIYDQIQSHRDSCDLNVILERYANGDASGLMARQGVYADVTGLPTTYTGMLNMVLHGQEEFDQLPAEVRAKFGNNFASFISGMDDMPDWLAKMGISPDPIESDLAESPKEKGGEPA